MVELPPAGVPGFVSAPCLGCGKPVEEAVMYLNIGGTRDGTWLLEMDSVTERMRSTDPGHMPQGAELLGVAHRGCGDLAKTRIELGLVTFPDQLPTLEQY